MDLDYYEDDIRLLQEINEIEEFNLNFVIRRQKFYSSRQNPFELEEQEFKTRYRFSKRTATHLIDLLKNDLVFDARGGSLPPYLQVLAAIRSWARSKIQDDTGELLGMSQPQVSIVCTRVAAAIAHKRSLYINMPQSESEQNKVIGDFYAICGFRQVIGAIDCTHIRIPRVGGDIGQYYINRKGFSSLNVQVVCNANLEIMDIVARWRGSTHDSRIFNESVLKTRFENGEFKGRLLGDSGYACTPYLFTPLLNPNTTKEEAYNKSQIRTRNTIERCFGVWKQRFRCLLDGFRCSLQNAKLYIVALAILHNIAIREGLNDLNLDEENFMEVPVDAVENLNVRGNAARAAFIQANF